jgi:hypothetical protein
MKNTIVFELDSKVSIYVPSTSEVNKADIGNLQDYFVNQTIKEFSELFGGATATDAVGGWLSKEKGIVTERIKIVYAYCTKEAFANAYDQVLSLARQICLAMNQEAVTLEYNGKVAFITPAMVA